MALAVQSLLVATLISFPETVQFATSYYRWINENLLNIARFNATGAKLLFPLNYPMPNKSINFAPTAPDAAKLRRLLRR